jgi:hypothetical protein
MNWSALEKKLIATARKNPPNDRTPYAFEQRVMARLNSCSARDEWSWFNRALWVGAGACTAVAVAASIWLLKPNEGSELNAAFSHGVEQRLFASADEPENGW